MKRKQSRLVPSGDSLSDLDGLVTAIPAASPPARRGFTRFDQVNQLVLAREADPDRGFMARMMALCSLPRTNPGNRHQYKRVNGPYKLIMSTTGEYKLPFGHLPRLLMAWISTEAVRTQSRTLILGDSLSDFMRERRCCMIQLRREWGRFSNFSFRTPQRRISAYPARPSG